MQLLTSSGRPPGDEPVSDAPEPLAEVRPAGRVRVLSSAAAGPLITGYALVTALIALVTLAAGRFSATGALLAAGPGWLAAYQVQLGLGGHPLGVLPLLPTAGAALLVVRTASGAVQRLGLGRPGQAVPLVAVITGAHALFGLVIAISSLDTPVRVNPVPACAVPGALAALAATAGVVRRCGLPRAVAERLDPLAARGVRAGALGLAALVLAGALVFTLATVLSMSTVDNLFEPSIGSSFGLLLLSVLYLPNAVVAAMSFVTGPGFTVGSLEVSLVGYRGGDVPALPLLGGIPEHSAGWWPALLVLPAAVGALVGWSVRRVDDDPAARIRVVAVAGAVVGFGCVVLGTLAGGRLGDGPFDPVSVPVGVASIVAFCWIVIPGGFVAFFAGAHAPPTPPNTVDVGPDEVFDGAADFEDEDGEESEEDAAEEAGDESEAPEEPGADVGEQDEFDAEAEAELGLQQPEDVVVEEPDPQVGTPGAVTGSTEASVDEKAPEDDR
ncbi:DUF6350 family protein [Amycolatopsis sp. PS_44_ISF1]|uniref:cell division protein PerM n=1 Tax=Amycolatopsis sp. PS_44_ISF1 TaxID=2974917 RepID=UPI0028DEE16C|nr:DUF6350 family protein [Amycolatopsis sp. PS_44_ISF1]MDT8909626.1 DUF6350 family protein [Amycolatopsis sp. PS_44_ISF1]